MADRDPVAILRSQTSRVFAELLPIRYGRMLVSPFTFFRGAAAVMAADLAATPTSGLIVQLCGDAHISNFGGFAAPDRRLVFGPNDFDETLPGPWEWDVKRMAASIEIAARELGLPASAGGGWCSGASASTARACANSPPERMLDAWYERLDADELTARFGTRLDADGRELFTQRSRRAAARRALARREADRMVDGKLRFTSAPPLLTRWRAAASEVRRSARPGCTAADAYTAGLHADDSTSFGLRLRTWRARWSGWAASAPAPGCSSSWAAAPTR